MVYRKISSDMKQQALELLTEGWTAEEVAEVLHVSCKSIGRWEGKMEETGCVDSSSVLRGRPRLLDPVVVEDLRELILESPSLYLDEIREYLAFFHDLRISTTALHDNLQDLGLTYKLLQRAAAERDEEARATWHADIVAHISAEQIVTIDDILPALSLDGYIALRIVEGSVNSIEFYDFVVNDVLPKMNRYPNPRSILVMDNCAIHKSDALRQAVEAAGKYVNLVFFPFWFM
ncbi:hypothetical protein BJ138DRAFT_1020774 [Hygrophoropsis aurantiaca]|uniref:Uncharacterized protein n=1 Tax=Hygrophoropsis aurantiaca TaxID=72124 RepID=A0ACB7ZQI6_9AGAM|nr:hypothetical protein BJ138DRAFT_1020774 [Hygrophoropsis aurantiaca]